jgi:hypothetical protein
MKFAKFHSIDHDRDFYLNPNYVCLLTPYKDDGGTTITSHYGEFHVDIDIDIVAPSFEFMVKFTNLANDKVFYINPSYVAEIIPYDGKTKILSHQGEFTIGMPIDEVAVYLNEGLSKTS